jgi:uncharacterized alkaline shock family protein YloU
MGRNGVDMTERGSGRGHPLGSERGATRIEEPVVAKVAGIAAQEIEDVQMGGSTAIGGLISSVTGDDGLTRGAYVEVGEEEAAIDLTPTVEYGKSIPRTTDAVRLNIINRVENLLGLRVTEVNITVADVWFREDHSPRTPEGNEGQGSVAPRGRHGSE